MAGLKEFKRVAGATEEVAKLQARLYEFFTQFIDNPLLNGVQLTKIELGTTAVNVDHKLGRECQGWIITNKNANADVWQTDSSKSSIVLQASANVVVDLWVF
jgi:hypothetical protein